jgi:glycogen synthase
MCCCREEPAAWRELSARNMRVDHSWQKSAGCYVDIYNQIAA